MRIQEAAQKISVEGMNELEAMEAQLAEVEQLQFPASLDLLDDSEVWIADMGTPNHSTTYKFGSIN